MHSMSTVHRMATMTRVANMSSWPDRPSMKDLLLAGVLVVQRVHPSLIVREVHLNRLRLSRHAAGGSAATSFAGMVRVQLGRGIVVPMVLQEGTSREQRLRVPVRHRHGRHELQAEAALHVVEAPIPNAEAAVVVHLRLRTRTNQTHLQRPQPGEEKPRISPRVPVSPSPQPPSSNRQSLHTHHSGNQTNHQVPNRMKT